MRQLPSVHNNHCNPVGTRSLAATISQSAPPWRTNLQPLEQPLLQLLTRMPLRGPFCTTAASAAFKSKAVPGMHFITPSGRAAPCKIIMSVKSLPRGMMMMMT